MVKVNRHKENLIVNFNMDDKPIAQQDGFVVFDAEMFKYLDYKESTSVLLGLESDFYLDLLLELKKYKGDDDVIFCANILDNFEELKKKINVDNAAITVGSGVLASFDDENNFTVIKEIR